MAALRVRHDDDIPALCTILAEQQPTSGYPFRWPLPMPVEHFIARTTDITAWVAVPDHLGQDGRRNQTSPLGHDELYGHVAVGRVIDDEFGSVFTAALNRPAETMLSVTALFTSLEARGRGVGSVLLAQAETFVLGQGRLPVLDVLPTHAAALTLYERRGWHVIDEGRAAWLPDDVAPIQYMALLGA